ncbi:hypothetical protein GWK48_10235 [Metallosphaera tengchongensis]|uniref:Uncharacterized protein n=1 Tax=Metallosphaera tengchongensis TaxID=1532350 RepID=A0A6N0NV28_9CREN|nr:hypothetical protein [Metallosphaera tengchongensis]QKR00714.1 hypothetical protein GWK48_10235 [Metallosphaera tengchongensis]
MSEKLGFGKTSLRWVAMLLSALWAGVHLDLTTAVLPNPTATLVYRIFFGFVASLALVAAAAFIQGLRSLYLPAALFYVIDLGLLVETRTAPALLIGKRLPFNPYVDISLVLDVILVIVSLLLWRVDRK